MKRRFNAILWREGLWYIAQCLEADVASQGKTEKEALTNFSEALELHFEEPRATIAPKLHQIKVDIGAA